MKILRLFRHSTLNENIVNKFNGRTFVYITFAYYLYYFLEYIFHNELGMYIYIYNIHTSFIMENIFLEVAIPSALLTWTCDCLREKIKRQFGCLEEELRMEEVKLAGLFTME